jgi:hypothetical protein
MPGFSTSLRRPPTQTSEGSPGSGESTYHAVLPPRVHGVGAARDHEIGIEALHPRAELGDAAGGHLRARTEPAKGSPHGLGVEAVAGFVGDQDPHGLAPPLFAEHPVGPRLQEPLAGPLYWTLRTFCACSPFLPRAGS